VARRWQRQGDGTDFYATAIALLGPQRQQQGDRICNVFTAGALAVVRFAKIFTPET
jgi:hypothetical protein